MLPAIHPVRVVQDDSICLCEVEAQSSCSRTQQEHHTGRVTLEFSNVYLTIGKAHGAVQSAVDHTSHLQIVLQYVQHTSELGEHESLGRKKKNCHVQRIVVYNYCRAGSEANNRTT